MEAKQQNDSGLYSFPSEVKMSKYQPIDVKPVLTKKWIENGVNSINFKSYSDAYDDSPTNASIINAFVAYIVGKGLIDKNGFALEKYVTKEDILLIVHDFKKFGGYAIEIIWKDVKPLLFQHIPINKLAINYNPKNMKPNGYWYCYDWNKKGTFKPVLYPEFTGVYKENPLEILYVKRPSSESFFPIPDYLAGIPWAQVEGEMANTAINHFLNSLQTITVINYNDGEITDPVLREKKANQIRQDITGTTKTGSVVVSFNESVENSVTIDKIAPPELNQQNVFYAEEAERKIIVSHSAPPILFSGSNSGTGFSSNAEEREVALADMYVRLINPIREIILNGFQKVFKVIDPNIKCDFRNFGVEKELKQ